MAWRSGPGPRVGGTVECMAWDGQLIWMPPSGPVGDRVVLFRRNIQVGVLPQQAPIRIYADSRFVLSVNGTQVARGPARSQPRRRLADVIDLAPFLRIGKNTIAVQVRFYGQTTAWWRPAVPTMTVGTGCLVAEMELLDTSGVHLDRIVTDDAWRARSGDAWMPQKARGIGSVLSEEVDARLLPRGWALPSHDDSDTNGWAAAHVLTSVHIGAKGRTSPPIEPYGAIRTAPLPPMTVSATEIEAPLANTIIPLGRVMAGPRGDSHRASTRGGPQRGRRLPRPTPPQYAPYLHGPGFRRHHLDHGPAWRTIRRGPGSACCRFICAHTVVEVLGDESTANGWRISSDERPSA